MPTLLDRVKRCKEQLGVSYKTMLKTCQIPVSIFYNFTGGIRDLPERFVERLDQYLRGLGY